MQVYHQRDRLQKEHTEIFHMEESAAWNRKRTENTYRERAARARMRRARKVRFLYGLIAAVMVLIILTVCLLRFGFSANADEKPEKGEKRYTSVLITYDMSAEDYAALYADPQYYHSERAYLKEVCSINHLALSNGEIEGLMPGNYIIIPYYEETQTSSPQ